MENMVRKFPEDKIFRIVFNEITPHAIKDAVANYHQIDMLKVEAQKTRQILDKLVGFKISPILWEKMKNYKLSAGRVQSVAVKMICEREDEIESFIKEGVKIIINGELDDPRIPSEIIEVFNSATERTKNNTEHIFNVLFNYGGRKEFVRVCKSACLDYLERSKKGDTALDFLNEEYLQNKFDSSLPDVDLLIRTSGEERISNCLLYEKLLFRQ